MGKAVVDMTANFNEFWQHALSVPVDRLLGGSEKVLADAGRDQRLQELHSYALDEINFEHSVRQKINDLPDYFPSLIESMVWGDVDFISDVPGKNANRFQLSGGGETAQALMDAISRAQTSVLIQSPYLVIPGDGISQLKALVDRGVSVTIVTNSLASTDNLMAFSGYHKQRQPLLDAGVELYEFKPHPAIQQTLNQRYPRLRGKNPVFAIHAKSMVIDGRNLFVGTFNLDPRSANLNTEVGVLINSEVLAAQLQSSIMKDTRDENSWHIRHDFNPDGEVDSLKRFKLQLLKWLPLKPVL